MIITDNFVMLNLPKTGSSFARAVIKEIYANRKPTWRQRLSGRRPFIKELLINESQHGTYSDIPPEYRDREIVSIVRNPYQRILSSFEFRHWAYFPMVCEKRTRDLFPHFPDLSLNEYLVLLKLTTEEHPSWAGEQTIQFIQMFFREPTRVIENLSEGYLESQEALNDIADITFLRQERLSEDLANFLARKGFSQAEVDYVRSRDKVNVTVRTDSRERSELWTDEATQHVASRERLVFHMLRSRGIHYNGPDLVSTGCPVGGLTVAGQAEKVA